jgi:hypothetical protein
LLLRQAFDWFDVDKRGVLNAAQLKDVLRAVDVLPEVITVSPACWCLLSAICYLLSAICYLLYAICCLLFAVILKLT